MTNYFEICNSKFRPIIYFTDKAYGPYERGAELQPENKKYLGICHRALIKIYKYDNKLYYSWK
jgi:hypothetical protein